MEEIPYMVAEWASIDNYLSFMNGIGLHTETQEMGSLYELRVHLAAIMVFHHEVDEFLIFTYTTTKCFLKGLCNLCPEIQAPTSLWDLNLMVQCLMGATFEPLATCYFSTSR